MSQETSAEEFEDEDPTTLGELGVFDGNKGDDKDNSTPEPSGGVKSAENEKDKPKGAPEAVQQDEKPTGDQTKSHPKDKDESKRHSASSESKSARASAQEGNTTDMKPKSGSSSKSARSSVNENKNSVLADVDTDEEIFTTPDLQQWDPDFGFDSTFEEEDEEPLMIDIDETEAVDAMNNETQTQPEALSFEDPRLFDIDLGRKKKGSHKVSKRMVKKSKGQEEYQEESQNDYKRSQELPGEDMEPKPKTSLEEFDELFMKISDSCVMKRMSEDAIMESRTSTPSPPQSPGPDVSPRINRCPSIESFFKLSEKITIHFYILPGKKVYSRDVRLDQTIADIKEELSRIVKVPAKHLELRRKKNLVMDYKTIRDIGGRPGKKMRFTVEINKRYQGVWELKLPEDNKLPPRENGLKSVKIPTGFGWKTINVSIEFPVDRKLFIGGYRHKVTSVEYHHAWTQTPIIKREFRETQKSKATQSFHESHNCMQTVVNTYTQVDRPDYFISCQKQRLVRAGRYVTAAQWQRKREKAAITIQRYWRRWLAIREREERMKGLLKRVQWAEQVRKGRLEIRLAIKDDELYRQYNPTTLHDIELLYRAINSWRKQEVDYVLMNRWGAEKKAALADIMEKEADLLLDLERAKSKIVNEKNKHLVEDLFSKMGAPSRWLSRTGHFLTVDDSGKERVRAYQDLYHELKKPVTDVNQRLELLDRLYKLIKNHKTVTTDYLIQLIGREIALIERKSRERILTGLRKRILTGFFSICRDTKFNPESKKLQKIPFDTMKLRKDMIQCKGCRQMLYRDQFTISRGVTVTNWCLTCMGLYRTCILRADMNLYRRMLQELRQDEQEQGVESSVAYVIDAYDLQFLIEQIWHGQSALSGIDDRYLLRLCRWIKEKPWTPWNCVLLTEEEAVAHLHIRNMTTAYQHSFFEKVRLRHNAARSYFQRTSKISLSLIPDLEAKCREREVLKKEKKKADSTRRSTVSLLNL